MRYIYRALSIREKALVWLGLLAGSLGLLGIYGGRIGSVGLSQVIVALGTLALAGLALRQVDEMRAGREANERPQVIVDADYSRYPYVSVVVRNIGNGPARNITFQFSDPMVHSLGNVPPVDELPIFKDGLPYLAPGAEFSTGWDSITPLVNTLEKSDLQNGITVTTRYTSLDGKPGETTWNINPLRMAAVHFGEKGIEDLAKAVEKIAKISKEDLSLRKKELEILTEIKSIQRQMYRPMESFKRAQAKRSAADQQVRNRIIMAVCAEWKLTEGHLHSKTVYERLVREGEEPPANVMNELLWELKGKLLINGPFMHGRDEIPKHGNMRITSVDPELCEAD